MPKDLSLPFDKEQIKHIIEKYPTPFHIYDEKAIRANVRRFLKAFAWAPEFKEYFAVKATPNPHLLKILQEEGLGVDCSSMAELVLADKCGFRGEDIMLTSNETPVEEFAKAMELGAVLNLDDITHIAYLEENLSLPKTISFRYNPGSLRSGNAIIGNPTEAKCGLTHEQILEALTTMRDKGCEKFGLHTMIASNELHEPYFVETAIMMFNLIKEVHDKLVNLVDSIIAINKKLNNEKDSNMATMLKRQIKAIDDNIDKIVYELYRLNKNEIKLVENNL